MGRELSQGGNWNLGEINHQGEIWVGFREKDDNETGRSWLCVGKSEILVHEENGGAHMQH